MMETAAATTEPGSSSSVPSRAELDALIERLAENTTKQREARSRQRAAIEEVRRLDRECADLRDQIDRTIDRFIDPPTVQVIPNPKR